jgi:hypothetical protein
MCLLTYLPLQGPNLASHSLKMAVTVLGVTDKGNKSEVTAVALRVTE